MIALIVSTMFIALMIMVRFNHLDEIATKDAHIRHLKSVISDLKLTAKRDKVLIEQAAAKLKEKRR